MAKPSVKEELAKKAGAIKGEPPEKKVQTPVADAAINPDREKRTIRLLRADEIECRVGSVSEKGLSILLFKDARVDQRILDETFTPFWLEKNSPVHRREFILHS